MNEGPDLSAHDGDRLNHLAKALTELFGFLPLDVRFGAAAAALDYVAQHSGTDPTETEEVWW